MRPRGEIREALSTAAKTLAANAAGFTYLELAMASQVGFSAARQTTKDMVKAGELEPVGSRQVPGIKRPLRTYRPGQQESRAPRDGVQLLARAVGNWVTSY
jgi:hypothetical protein